MGGVNFFVPRWGIYWSKQLEGKEHSLRMWLKNQAAPNCVGTPYQDSY